MPQRTQRRRLSRKLHSTETLPQHFEYENEYEKWKAENPQHKTYEIDFSIDETGYIYWFWTFFVVLGCLYNITILPVLAFENVRLSYFEKIYPVNLFCDLIFLLDIIIRSRLSFHEDGVLITSGPEIRKKYLNSLYFSIDIIAIIPFDLVFKNRISSAFCRLNRFLKIYRIPNLISQSYGKLGQVTISLSKILLSCFLLFHCNACVYYIISVNSDTTGWDGVNATFDDDEQLPWPYMPEKITDVYLVGCEGNEDCYNPDFYFDEEREQNLLTLYHFWQEKNRTKLIEFSTFTKEYTLSMYWSAMTMTTLGEQPYPNTSIQNVFEILNTIVGLLLFAVIMGSIGDLVSNANKVKSFWQTLMDGLKQYMTYRNLIPELQTKVLKYCEYEMGEETILKEHEVRDELPSKLYGQVTTSIIGTSLLKSPLFRASERGFLNDIAECLEPHYFSPGDIIAEKGQHCNNMFIIIYGNIIEMTDTEEIDHFEGEVLGDVNLIWFTNHKNSNRHLHDFVSNSFSQIHLLARDDFLKVLSYYDETLKKRLCDVAYGTLQKRGELNDSVGALIENEDLETNFKRLSLTTSEIENSLCSLDTHFKNFTQTAKQRLFKAELIMLNLYNSHYQSSKKTRD